MSKHINMSGLKTLLEPLVHLINKKAERPDWNENDPSSPSYITNRPFYGNGNTLFNGNIYIDSHYQADFVLKGISFKEGEYYSVVWNGELYECIAYKDEWNEICIGDPQIAEHIWGGYFNSNVGCDAPFFMCSQDEPGFHYDGVLGPEGTHTIEITQGYIKKLDKKYLPDLDLAYVATSGSYNDLINTPTIYTDVIRYDVSQNLSTSQKAQARVNIDAIEIDDLATVASSGDYNDLENKLCSRVGGYSEWITLSCVNSPESANPAGNTFVRWKSYVSLHHDKYPRAWKLYEDNTVYLTTEYCKGKTFSDSIYRDYCYWGNASLYNSSWENTGEDWCIYVYGDSYPHTIGCYIKGKNIDYATLITSYTQDDAWFSGDVYVGSTSGTNKDEGSKKLATESYVDEKIETIEIPVDSVNGKTGEVVLTANDIGAMKATDPTGTGSLSVNRLARTNIGSNSCAIGTSTRAQGNSSCAMGYYTQADGDYSFAMGRQAYARGKSSVAFGDNNVAIGNYSYTEGCGLTSGLSLTGEANAKVYTYSESPFVESRITEGLFVLYKNSHAQIIQLDKDNRVITLTASLSSEALNATTVTILLGGASVGTSSHVEGECTTAGGNYSHSEGEWTIAGSKGQHVQGRYNITDISNTHAHIVGNGKSYSLRSNAHTLDWQGNAWYSGDVYVGSTSGTNKDEGSKKLATEDFVNAAHTAITFERIDEICNAELDI